MEPTLMRCPLPRARKPGRKAREKAMSAVTLVVIMVTTSFMSSGTTRKGGLRHTAWQGGQAPYAVETSSLLMHPPTIALPPLWRTPSHRSGTPFVLPCTSPFPLALTCSVL
eukprot:scaffold33663_cov32-Tisochrysis_lutea.AAC.1